MYYDVLETGDGCKLAFQTSISITSVPRPAAVPNRLLLLLHGFSGSSAYFTRNHADLSAPDAGCWVVAPDMRGHGRSGRPTGGYHVARLAADLHELLAHLQNMYTEATSPSTVEEELQITLVGCSIGAAIIWTHIELYGNHHPHIAGLVFVDQAPLQDRLFLSDSHPDNWDHTKHHTDCYDEASLARAQQAWMLPPDRMMGETYRGLVRECLGYHQPGYRGPPVSAEQMAADETFFAEISALCDGRWLARLMADHTRYDHREAIEVIQVPSLIMAGGRSGCFPLAGILETAKRMEKAGKKGLVEVSVFKESGHWLFYEDALRFNREVLDFVNRCSRR